MNRIKFIGLLAIGLCICLKAEAQTFLRGTVKDSRESLIGVNGDPAFIEKLKSRLEQRSYSTLYNVLPKDRRGDCAYLFSFIEYGSIGICETWLNSGMCETPGAMAEITEKFILGALGAFE